VYIVAFSPDGRLLATASLDGTVRLWNVATRQQIRVLSGHTGSVWSLAFNPQGTLLASGGSQDDNTIRLWNVATGQQVGVLNGHTDGVLSVAFSPDGKTLASGGGDRTVRLWNAATSQPDGEPLKGPNGEGHTDGVWIVAFSPDGKTLASGSLDDTIRLWDLTNRTSRGTPLTSYPSAVYGLAFSPDGKTLASGGSDKLIVLWNVRTGYGDGERLERHLAGHSDTVWSVAFSPDGKTLASGGADKTIRLWNVATGRQLHVLGPGDPTGGRPGHDEAVHCVAFSPDGTMLASSSDDKTIRLWNVATGQQLRVLGPGDRSGGRPGHTDAVLSVAFSPKNGRLLASASEDGTLRLWNTTGQLIWSSVPIRGAVLSVAFRRDGTLLASGGTDAIHVWHVQAERLSEDPKAKIVIAPTYSVAFSPDGALLASDSADYMMRIWIVGTGLPMGLPLEVNTAWHSLAFSPDGTLLALVDADEVLLLDVSRSSWERQACRIANRNLTPDEWTQWISDPRLPYQQYGHPCSP
jgi:WD40 repeat protein